MTISVTKNLGLIRVNRQVLTDLVSKLEGFDKIRFKNGRMGFRINEERLGCLKNKYRITHDAEGSEGSEG